MIQNLSTYFNAVVWTFSIADSHLLAAVHLTYFRYLPPEYPFTFKEEKKFIHSIEVF